MKRQLLFASFVLAFILSACSKDDAEAPEKISGVSVQKISYSSLTDSPWEHIAGGTIILEFGQMNENGVITTKIVDSVDLEEVSAFKKQLTNGKYDVTVTSRNQSTVADTFVRFTAELKSYDVLGDQGMSMTAISKDGLITIPRIAVRTGTVPTFQSDIDPKTYKFALAEDFYYLYVKAGITGTISLTSKNNLSTDKEVSVAALEHYHFKVLTDAGNSIMEPATFAYFNNGTPLLTLNLMENDLTGNRSTYLVLTDENGNVLNEIRYRPGLRQATISSLEPYEKERFNFYLISTAQASDTSPSVAGFLQIKKGSIFTNSRPIEPQKAVTSPLKFNLKNVPAFDKLFLSTDLVGGNINPDGDLDNFTFFFSDDSQIWAQTITDDKAMYNFFDITKGTLSYDLDLSKLTKKALSKTFSSPGENLQVNIFARKDKGFDMWYDFGMYYSQDDQVKYFYPSEEFQEYYTKMHYSVGELHYSIATSASSLPSTATSFDASFTTTGSNLANFTHSASGSFDYYQAQFSAVEPDEAVSLSLFSPAAADYFKITIPELSQYLGINQLDLSTLKLERYGLYAVDNFSETDFWYETFSNKISGKSVEKVY